MRQVTHVISELLHCKDNLSLLTDHLALEEVLTRLTVQAGMTVVSKVMYPFEEGGVTGSLVLAESHLNIHTWPERDYYINLDISVCNYCSDNKDKAIRLFESIRDHFKPIDVNHRIIEGYRDVEDEKYTEYFSRDYGFFIKPKAILFNEQDETQSMAVYETKDFGRLLRLDNYFQTSEVDEFFYHEPLVQPTMIAHQNPKRVLIIGGGDGGVAKNVALHNSVERIVMVEIDPRVAEVSKQWMPGVHGGVFDDPRFELVIGDGLVYVKETKEKFDVILLDLTDPIGPATELYTQDFYKDLKHLLADEHGVLGLHTEYPFLYPETFGRINATLRSLFTHVANGFNFVPMFGAVMSFAYASDSVNAKTLSRDTVAQRIKQRGLKKLKQYNLEQHYGLMAAPEYAVQALANHQEVITKASDLSGFALLYNQKRKAFDE